MDRNIIVATTLPLLLAACAGAVPEPANAGASSAAPPAGPAPGPAGPDLSRFFQDVDGTFVLLDPRTGSRVVHDAERARTRFLPASTFKIPNTLIALETGVASGPDFALVRDTVAAPSESWWPASWVRNHTLETALPASVVWFHQELARRIGAERMRAELLRFGYGNQDISGGIDRFWLTGGLRVSAEEQVEFLRRFHAGELGLSDRTTRIAKRLLVLEETPNHRLSGKTGWAGFGGSSGRDIGWLVGYVERGDDVHVFALNLDIRSNADAARRVSITRAILTELGLIE